MTVREQLEHLELFEIAQGDGTAAQDVRRVFARLLEADGLSMGELQTMRDIVELASVKAADVPLVLLFLAAMFLSRRQGNSCMREGDGAAFLLHAAYMDPEPEGFLSFAAFQETVAAQWHEVCDAARRWWPTEAAEPTDRGTDVILHQGDRWFFSGDFKALYVIDERLRAWTQTAMPALADGVGDGLSEAALTAACTFSFTLNEAQIRAVKTIAKQRFAVITGGPGTGKTTIVCSILRALLGQDDGKLETDEVALVAPTGRAAQRMGEALRNQCVTAQGLDETLRRRIESLEGTTIHRLLGSNASHFKYGAENRLNLKLVIVDEASMVDIHIMRALLEALPTDCKLVLLGDADQLPPVGVGAVLGDIVGPYASQDAQGQGNVVRLTESNRFRPPLADAAKAINAGSPSAFLNSSVRLELEAEWLKRVMELESENHCFFLRQNNKEKCHAAVIQWAEAWGLLKDGALERLASSGDLQHDEALARGENGRLTRKIFRQLESSRILCVVRDGPCGVQTINRMLTLKRYGGRMPFNPLQKPGVPVIVTRNTPERNLWNGDVGVTVSDGNGGTVVLFPRGNKVVSCPVGLLPEHELAYAITIHKSQGSEFDNVLVLLTDDVNNPLLSRQLVYTGVTRARKRAVILGTELALEKALQTEPVRNSGLRREGNPQLDESQYKLYK